MDTKDKIRQFLMKELKEINEEVEYLEDDTPIIDNGVLDSLILLNLLAFLEENFGVSLTNNEFDSEHCGSVRKISDFVTKKMVHVH